MAKHLCLRGVWSVARAAVLLTWAPLVSAIDPTTITLAWDPSPSPGVVGYLLHYHTASENYADIIDVGNTNSIVLTSLVPGETYYFAVVACTATDTFSLFSNEVPYYVFSVPIAFDILVKPKEDVKTKIVLNATDADGGGLKYRITSGPTNGTLKGTPPIVYYQSKSNYYGPDSFNFVANDGVYDSNPGKVTVNVVAVNDRPWAISETISGQEDTSLSLALEGGDIEGSALKYVLTVTPTNGILSGTAPNLTYTPRANFYGQDFLSFKVSDGKLYSAEALITLVIAPVNDPPVANNIDVNIPANGTVSIVLSGTDIESSPLTYSLVSQPTHGTLTGTAPNLVYKPVSGYVGLDTFRYRVRDGNLSSPYATVTVRITSNNNGGL